VEATFQSALNMVPNGLMIIDYQARQIVFANKEMDALVDGISGTCLKERICSFMFESNISDTKSLETSNTSSISQTSAKKNLWDMLLDS